MSATVKTTPPPAPSPGPSPTPVVLKNTTTDTSAAAASSKYAGMLIPLHSVIPGVPGPNPVSMIVQPNYSKGVRDVDEATKKAVAVRDGIDPATLPQYEVDHLIPLIWGGANDQGNLWCQPLAQARIKDVVEVHGLMYLRANPTTQALQGLQNAPNWIQAALTIVDPYIGGMKAQDRVRLMQDTAKDLVTTAKNPKLAAILFRELERAHTPRAQRKPPANPALMDDLDVSDQWNARKLAQQFRRLAEQAEAQAEQAGDLD